MNATITRLPNGDFTVAAPRPRPFNDGIRVFWSSGGSPIFRDHAGTKQFIHLSSLRAVIPALRKAAVAASQDGREREFIALSTVVAEAETALRDAVQWRMAARGLHIIGGL